MPRKSSGRPPGRPRYPGTLTPAEERVLAELRLGKTNLEIGAALGISADAVKYHVANMLGKTGAPDRYALAGWQPEDRRSAWPGWMRGTPGRAVGVGIAGLLVALVIAWWLALRATDSGERLAHATGPTDVLLRLERWGGMVYPGPMSGFELALYGDGLLIVGGGSTEIRLSEDGIQRLLAATINDGKMLEQPESHEYGVCADCDWRHIEMAVTGGHYETTVFPPHRRDPDPAWPDAYVRANAFADFLIDLNADWFPDSEVLSSGPYRPPGIGFVSRPIDELLGQGAVDWPASLPPLLPVESGNEAARFFCDPVASQLRDYLAGAGSLATSGGVLYAPAIRPLLPEELALHGCGP